MNSLPEIDFSVFGDLATDIQRHYEVTLGQDHEALEREYLYQAVALAIRDRLVVRRKQTDKMPVSKRVYYLSLEFLMGRALGNAALALALEDELTTVITRLGASLEEIAAAEHDAGLGNGGLGRLAACFMDSCATLGLPVTGYGLRYEYGMFHQRIEQGRQIEYPDHWLRDGNPWEFHRPEDARRIRFYGRTELKQGHDGSFSVHWLDTEDVIAMPYDLLIPGHGNEIVNRLRLWKAESTDSFDLASFNAGSYPEAVSEKILAENITMVLYPNDANENGKVLRLRQQYLLASASLQDVVANWTREHGRSFDGFAAANVFQLNDTHPTCAIPELMRILLDEYQLGWDEAYAITSNCMAYTNHTLLPEALERWSVPIFAHLLPRLLEIIYEINARFMVEVASRWPGDLDRLRRMSIIDEVGERSVRMSHLGIVGSFSVNGVAALHTELLKSELFRDFHDLWPHKFNNKTNGVTPRRWIQYANKPMSRLISSAIGEGWQRNLEDLAELAPMAEDAGFRAEWQAIKLANKQKLATLVQANTGVRLDPEWMLDVQVKRIHEYKRQLLNILQVIHLYDRIHRGDTDGLMPKSVLIGGKAAPGYEQAKLIIQLINSVAEVVNKDPVSRPYLRVVFLSNYDVTSMEIICPAAELSEQISTAGKEASGTGNMKFMMNGALTIGTLDGANIEILDRVGDEHFFRFGLSAREVAETRGHYDPTGIISADEDLRRALDLIDADHFSMFSPGLFSGITASVRDPHDPWLIAADFRDYLTTHQHIMSVYADTDAWQRSSIQNTAASGWFSSDRTIMEYARDIWSLTK